MGLEMDIPVVELEPPADVDILCNGQFIPVSDTVQRTPAEGADHSGYGKEAAVNLLGTFQEPDDG